MKRGYTVALTLILVLSISFISAGFWDNFKLTGKATSQATDVSITVSGSNPAVVTIPSISNQNPTEATTTTLNFNVYMSDSDGVADLDDSSVAANVTDGTTTHSDASCSWVNDIDSTTANYTCSVTMDYWDTAGTWNIGASGADLGSGSTTHNTTATFTYNQLKAMVISPASLTWPSVTPGATNQTSNNDATVINNTGNYDGTITVTAIDLLGDTTPSESITADSFTVGISTGAGNPECAGTALQNSTAVEITSSDSNPGNLSLGSGSGQEQLYYCIPELGAVSSQAYSTSQGGSWTIAF